METRLKSDLVHRLLHLDLKGAPPKPSYLKSLYPTLVNLGITGLLLEWEDCFPYEDVFEVLNSKKYPKDDAIQIVHDAKEAKLEVIPLVQTFGHLEFVLKHPEYVKLREVPLFPSSLCPSHPDAVGLVTSLVEQVIKFHVGIKSLHIGADEVWHMGLCAKCKSRIEEGESRDDLFLTHVKKVVTAIKQKWPLLNIIMWDDMLRETDETVIKSYGLESLVEPMVWHYNPSESFWLPPDIWQKYSVFNFIWVASAFKGASGGSQLLPPINHHASNTYQWTCTIPRIKSRLSGIALTGWSRYDHFAALCELLPTSIASLSVCLKVLEEKSFTPSTEPLSSYPNSAIDSLSHSYQVPEQINFSGWQIVCGISRLVKIRVSANAVIQSEQLQTWMNDWQVANNIVNPMQLVSIIPVLHNLLVELNNVEKYLLTHLTLVYYPSTIEEWMGTYITPLKHKLTTIVQTAEGVLDKSNKFVEEASLSELMDC